MSKKNKLYIKISGSRHNTSFRDLKKLLESYGFIVENHTGGSHYSVRHPKIDLPIKPLPFRTPVKAIYVKEFLKWIDEVNNLE